MVILLCHPSTRTDAVDWITAHAARGDDGTLAITFSLAGDLARVRIPEPRAPRMVNGLWEHTCFEVFVAAEGSRTYHEFNLSPSGEWMAHAFERYRVGGPLDDVCLAPQIVVSQQSGCLELNAALRLRDLSADYVRTRLQLGMCAVVEDTSGRLSYWAVRHPAGRPDFHHRETFATAI